MPPPADMFDCLKSNPVHIYLSGWGIEMHLISSGFARTVLAGAISTYAGLASAHDLTIYPQRQADSVLLTMFLGDPGDYQPIEQSQFIDLKFYKPKATTPVEIGPIKVDGNCARIATSSAALSDDVEGTYLISSHYDNRFAAFDANGRGYGTTKEWVRNSTDSAHFIKFAKSLFAVGRSDRSYSRVLGDRLELVPLADPFGEVIPGRTLPVRVLFDRQPLANHKVEVGDAAAASLGQNYQTDSRGVVRVPVDHDGFYRIAVDMRAKSHYPDLYDWDDYTASLVFRRK
ncbi:hypothetical protein MB02_07175 [Croceicoccus estronivorus]|uniref:DUF4198 domain-containing protein n=1 Tax=Croceicoccus estronivorus TaxID=1172626 RepID=UPI0008363719|nr:DUF4198 domain-containing protein [Croceicoccus estronivorus]OCC24360.1 hypothetical protein MB02_07175 [Croceicoccus estronivorus]